MGQRKAKQEEMQQWACKSPPWWLDASRNSNVGETFVYQKKKNKAKGEEEEDLIVGFFGEGPYVRTTSSAANNESNFFPHAEHQKQKQVRKIPKRFLTTKFSLNSRLFLMKATGNNLTERDRCWLIFSFLFFFWLFAFNFSLSSRAIFKLNPHLPFLSLSPTTSLFAYEDRVSSSC